MADRSTIYEVAKRSGVSTATVSRIMADGKGFSAATRERVRAVAAELGWVPNAAARGLASRRAGIVGLLFPDLGQSGEGEEELPLYVDQVIRGAERAATSVGDAVLIAATHSAAGRELAFSVAGKADGLVVMARSLSEDDITVLSRSVPVVVLANHYVRGGPDSIGADNRSGCRAMTTHLIRFHAYTDLAFLAGPPGSPDSDERFAGFCEALRRADLPAPDAPAATGGFTEAGGRQAVAALLAEGRSPRAIVCGNDEMAIGALTALRARRLRVPADVAVTGFDDIAAARHVRPALSTVRQPMRELGERSVRLLLARISDPAAPPRSVVLPTEVVIRRSCGCRSQPARTVLPREDDPPTSPRDPAEADMSAHLAVRPRAHDQLHEEPLPAAAPDRGTARFHFDLPVPGIARNRASAGRGTDLPQGQMTRTIMKPRSQIRSAAVCVCAAALLAADASACSSNSAGDSLRPWGTRLYRCRQPQRAARGCPALRVTAGHHDADPFLGRHHPRQRQRQCAGGACLTVTRRRETGRRDRKRLRVTLRGPGLQGENPGKKERS